GGVVVGGGGGEPMRAEPMRGGWCADATVRVRAGERPVRRATHVQRMCDRLPVGTPEWPLPTCGVDRVPQ
ncbi:hypothetical protein AQ750_00235, partial [Burkholderia pseudomallei]